MFPYYSILQCSQNLDRDMLWRVVSTWTPLHHRGRWRAPPPWRRPGIRRGPRRRRTDRRTAAPSATCGAPRSAGGRGVSRTRSWSGWSGTSSSRRGPPPGGTRGTLRRTGHRAGRVLLTVGDRWFKLHLSGLRFYFEASSRWHLANFAKMRVVEKGNMSFVMLRQIQMTSRRPLKVSIDINEGTLNIYENMKYENSEPKSIFALYL